MIIQGIVRIQGFVRIQGVHGKDFPINQPRCGFRERFRGMAYEGYISPSTLEAESITENGR